MTRVIESDAEALAGLSALVERCLPDEEDRAALLASILLPMEGKRALHLLAVEGADGGEDGRGDPVGLLVGGLAEGVLRLELIAVEPSAQGRGVGRALLVAAEAWARTAGSERIAAGGGAARYLWPGVGSRRTAALSLLLRHGFERTGIAFDMGVDLARLPDVPEPAPGIELVALGASDRNDALAVEAARTFSDGWAREVGLAATQPGSGGFAAVRDGAVLGFVGHAVYRPRSFGPLGTVAASRGTGIGGLLTLASLAAMRDAGIRTAEIGWIAEDALPFYARVSGAEVSESYWVLEKELG